VLTSLEECAKLAARILMEAVNAKGF